MVLAEITHAVLISDIIRGVPSAYVDLVGYDEVAHHSGIAAPEAHDTLRRIDDQIRRLLTTLSAAPRPYHVVVLSDHGQTQGSTFEQRYGQRFDELVRTLATGSAVQAPLLAGEGWNNVNGLLSDAAQDDSRLGRTVARATRSRSVDGAVALGRDEVAGDLVIGGQGVRHLDDDRVDGIDPLAPFGLNAAQHLRRTSGFTNCPDIIVNSFFDPVTDEGAAFEELIGFHGGLGGKQTKPFILAPSGLVQPTEPLVGAGSVHELFKSWLVELQENGTQEGGPHESLGLPARESDSSVDPSDPGRDEP